MNEVSSLSLSALRFGRGLVALHPASKLPSRPLELFEFEACPASRRVREAFTELDLGYISRTCAPFTTARDQALARAGRMQFPLLYDPNVDIGEGLWLYESETIIAHLHQRYGAGRPAWQTLPGFAHADATASVLAGLFRRRGLRVRPGLERRPQPERLLELWNFEASPYCRKVREVLTELGLDALVHNVGKRGRRRPELIALGGLMQVPYLIDPNTETAMYESEDIIAYLASTYG